MVSATMVAKRDGRVHLISYLFLTFKILTVYSFEVPPISIVALKPQGIRVSIPHQDGITLFVFHGNVNKQIGEEDVGTISGEVEEPSSNNQWVYENNNLKLKVDDAISYYVHVVHNSLGYTKDNQTFKVKELVSAAPGSGTTTPCQPSLTTVRGVAVCSGQVIFHDDFNTMNESIWTIEQMIPINHPEYPFVSYQKNAVKFENGALVITPKLQQLESGFSADVIYSGTLDLMNGCTESGEACHMTASTYDILPPVVSGRVTAKSMPFKYGLVEIRAKLPQGDWLYPELLLEPFLYKYGRGKFESGIVKIAAARGNRNLYDGNTNVGNQMLFGGAVINSKCFDTLLREGPSENQGWGSGYHTYSLRWEPERLVFSVDGHEWTRIEAGSSLRGQLPAACPTTLTGDKFAPFDTEFYLTLGVAAGGVTTFKDGVLSTGSPKPWTNGSPKAKLLFWNDLINWFPSWTSGPALTVDSVKVIAL